MKDIKIKTVNFLSLEDRKDIKNIVRNCYPQLKLKEKLLCESYLCPLGQIGSQVLNVHYILFDDNEAVAFSILRKNKIRGLFSKYRYKGYGRLLLDYIINDLKALNYNSVWIKKPFNNSKGFYNKQGFLKGNNRYTKRFDGREI